MGMKAILGFFVLTLVFCSRLCLSSSTTASLLSSFQTWCEEHGKSYSSEQERLYRLTVFQDNLDFVTKHNAMPNATYTLSLNAFADLTHHEFKASRLGLSPALSPKLSSKFIEVKDAPTSLDWRTKGAVTEVKNQGNCGACWAFSATGAIEGINKIVTGSLISVSEQELINCDTSYNTGCKGGLMDPAFKFIIKNHGIDTEEDYPFQEKDGVCNKDKLNRHVVTIDGYEDVPTNNEKQLLQAVATQPVSVGICGSERTFQLYSGGIFTGPCSTALDHAVLIVGYGSDNGKDYWIVKNSWGNTWGIKGYIHMQRNTGNSDGVCGINLLASYPTKTGQNPPPSPPSPPSPRPTPTRCSAFTTCEAGETCCCGGEIFGLCYSWRCCGLASAVCCKDHRHCCPQDYPTCDVKHNQCLRRSGSNGTAEALKFGGSSGKSYKWSSIIEGLVF